MMNDKEKYRQMVSESLDILRSVGLDDQRSIELLVLLFYAKMKGNLAIQKTSNDTDSQVDKLRAIAFKLKNSSDIDLSNALYQVSPELIGKLAYQWDRVDLQRGGYVLNETYSMQSFWEDVTAIIAPKGGYSYNMFTPKDVCELVAASVNESNVNSVYDPACGSAALLHFTAQKIAAVKTVVGAAQTVPEYQLAKMRELVDSDNVDLTIELSESGEPEAREKKFDLIVSNPPFGLKSHDIHFGQGEFSSTFRSKKSEIRFLTHILDHLNDDGQAAVIVPTGVLFNGAIVRDLREAIIEQNMLEAVVQLPAGIFYNTEVSTAVLFFNKSKMSNSTLFIDVSDQGIKAKTRTELSQRTVDTISKQVKAFRAGKLEVNEESWSNVAVATAKQIREKDYSLQTQHYKIVKTTSAPTRRKSQDILKECQAIEKRLTKLQSRFHDNGLYS